MLISEVFPDQPADNAGMRHGDIIIKVENIIIESNSQLARIIAGFKPGKILQIEVAREGNIQKLTVTLADNGNKQ